MLLIICAYCSDENNGLIILNCFLIGIRILVTLLLDTLPMLGNVFILCVLILMVFSIIGVQLWQGVLRGRCTLDLPYNASTYVKNNK